jgi:4'-phosphopantetheinyl transferase
MIWCDDDLARWQALPPETQTQAFYRAWTRKEALAKGIGHGMTIEFKRLRVDVSPDPGIEIFDTAALPDLDGPPQRWSLIAVDSAPSYAAALAIRAEPVHVITQRLTVQQLLAAEDAGAPLSV